MRFLHACGLWMIAAPATIIGYTFVTVKDWFGFVFNTPFDVWNMIQDAFREEDAEEELED
jgi:hypothetical protein